TLEERKYGTIRSKRTLDHFNDSSVKRFFNWKHRSK
ncbi:MAG TPA: ribonuclease BN, partial [Lactobacillus sp.]|nr:ribonuclease BN [Lactobacillus sp.]